jgi:predicted nucleic acid-binding protein
MDKEIICLDTSILIDFFRKTKKENSAFFKLNQKYSRFAVSIVTEYEVFAGMKETQKEFWDNFFSKITVLPFESSANEAAIKIHNQLKRKSKLIETADIFIAATAVSNSMKLATLNRKHFDRIDGLELMEVK